MKFLNKINVLLVFILVCMLVACNQKKESFYENGKLRQSTGYLNGKKSGQSVWYFPNGMKESEFNYKNDVLEGMSRRWRFNGSIISEINYKDGKKSGLSKWYNENAKLIIQAHFDMDLLNGDYNEYYPENGQVKIYGIYKKGNMDGNWVFYDEYGQTIGRGVFRNGNGKIQSVFSNGAVKKEYLYQNNQVIGDTSFFQNLQK